MEKSEQVRHGSERSERVGQGDGKVRAGQTWVGEVTASRARGRKVRAAQTWLREVTTGQTRGRGVTVGQTPVGEVIAGQTRG